jgi:L-2-hydroxyglutarate oxidase LhgO
VLLERNAGLAQEITARNSEIVHAGIYYPPGSLKAVLCVAGRRALYERCEKLRIPHRRLGKLIVATDADERSVLDTLFRRGRENGVEDLRVVDAAEVRRREPEVRALAALESPSTGIVDAHALCLSYAAESEQHGAVLALRTEAREIEPRSHGYRVATRDAGGESGALDCGAVVNAAGLAADTVAARAGLDLDARDYRLHPCKGDYFALAPGAPLRVSQLVYPVPDGPGLGVHLTLDLAGRVRFGPDAQYVDHLDYRVDPQKAGAFARAIAPASSTCWASSHPGSPPRGPSPFASWSCWPASSAPSIRSVVTPPLSRARRWRRRCCRRLADSAALPVPAPPGRGRSRAVAGRVVWAHSPRRRPR